VALDVGFETVELLSVAAGDQTYPVAPVPLSIIVLPKHNAAGGPASVGGKGFTVTVTTAVDVQVPCVAVTV
jgi:hypothetical protein